MHRLNKKHPVRQSSSSNNCEVAYSLDQDDVNNLTLQLNATTHSNKTNIKTTKISEAQDCKPTLPTTTNRPLNMLADPISTSNVLYDIEVDKKRKTDVMLESWWNTEIASHSTDRQFGGADTPKDLVK
jgi:hypothetical protein